MEISSDKDFLGPAPSYVLIRDPVRRLCHRMIAYSISGRGQAAEKVTGLISSASAAWTLGRLHICTMYGDTWAWVAQGPERQQAAAAGAPEADEAGQVAKEVVPEIPAPSPAPTQAPPPPPPTPPTPQPHVTSFTTEQSRISTWLISCITQLMDASAQTYQPFDSTLVGSSGLSFRRRVRPRTGDASTSAAPHTDAQPDP
ncbi:hypothetical protein Tco_1164096 [Tanacetum coccineum]